MTKKLNIANKWFILELTETLLLLAAGCYGAEGMFKFTQSTIMLIFAVFITRTASYPRLHFTKIIHANRISMPRQNIGNNILCLGRSLNTLTSDQHNSNCVQCGDASNIEHYKRIGMGPSSSQMADVLITDPPYCLLERRRTGGDLRDPKSRKRKLDDNAAVRRFRDVKDYKLFTLQWLAPAMQCLKSNGTVIVWTNALGKAPITQVMKNEFNYFLWGEYLWAKRGGINAGVMSSQNEVVLRVYETALVFGPAPLQPPTLKDRPIPWSVITGFHDDDKGVHPHPCHKPFAALEPLVRAWTEPEDLVLDCFAGSGGILSAAARLGRRVKGMELLQDWAVEANEAIAAAKTTISNQDKATTRHSPAHNGPIV